MFHPQFECSCKVNEIGYYLMKIGMSSQDLQHLIGSTHKIKTMHWYKILT
jgi:hypothetical protein